MKVTESIRRYYTPRQPAVREHDPNIVYREVLPAPPLQPYIYCYWRLSASGPLSEPFVYRVAADGCIDIFFEAGNPTESYVMGLCKRFTEFSLQHSFHYIGVRFLPSIFPLVFKVDASELTDRFEALEDVLPATSRFIAGRFAGAPTIDAFAQLFDNHFVNILRKNDFEPDHRFYNAMRTILQRSGSVHVGNDIDTGLSQRQLRRAFAYYIGGSPKTFSRIVRFQTILNAQPLGRKLRSDKVYYEAGYYDQAHFIREFKRFYGETPAAAFVR